MVNISEAFTTKVGPLPAIAWAGMAGGVFVVYKYATRDREPAIATVGGTPDYGGVGNADDFSNGYGNATGSFGGGGGTATGTVPPMAIADNVTWSQRAINYLVSTGTTVADATRAINAYLFGTGAALNSTQNAAWQRAVTHLGTPPEGVLDAPITTPGGGNDDPATNPPPVAPPIQYAYVSGNGTSTVSQLADTVPNKSSSWYTPFATSGVLVNGQRYQVNSVVPNGVSIPIRIRV
jgi:hypothetical protein